MKSSRVTLLLSLTCFACGSSGGLGKPVAQFPSKEQLQEVANHPAHVVAALKVVEVDRWQLQTPIPAVNAAYPSENEWDARVIAAASGKAGVRLAPELRCAATETARFFTLNDGYPEDGLRRFLLGRCGSTLGAAGFETLTLTVPEGTPDASVSEGFAKGAADLIARHLSKPGQEFGLGFARGNGRAALIAYSGVPSGRLHDFSPLVQGSSITLTGELPKGAEQVLGFVNQGDYGVKLCEPDRALALPAFRLACGVAEGDETVRIEVASRRANQVLMNVNLQVLARRSDEIGLSYEANKTPTASATSAAAFEQTLFETLNATRQKAGVRPLQLEAEQSRTNERLVPHFFQHMMQGNEEATDMIGLGLLAGWDVSGMIRDGGIFSGLVASSRNPGRWLSFALESPLGRWVLLDAGMSRVAVGAGALEPSGSVAVVTTYAFFDAVDHRSDETAVFNELGKVRIAKGHAPPRRAANSGAMQAALAKVSLGSATTEEAMQEALSQIVHDQQRSVQGWMLETSDLKHLLFSDALLAPGPVEVEVGVTHYKAPGGAWGQYAVLFVVYDAPGVPTQTAKHETARNPL